jgi:hypothetical protein
MNVGIPNPRPTPNAILSAVLYRGDVGLFVLSGPEKSVEVLIGVAVR